MIGAAVEMFPELHQIMTNLLPEGVQREDNGTGGGGAGGGAAGGASSRAAAKRAGADLFNKSKSGQRKTEKAERERKAAGAISTAVSGALSTVMTELIPSLSGGGGGDAAARDKAEKAAAQSATLALAQERGEAHARWTVQLRELTLQLVEGEEEPFKVGWLKKQIKDLETAMMMAE